MTAPLDLEALRALAEAMPDEPWHAHENDLVGGWCVGTGDYTPAYGPQGADVADFISEQSARYIAAVSPDVVLALIDAAEQAQRYREALERALRRASEVPVMYYIVGTIWEMTGFTKEQFDCNRAALLEGIRAALAAPEARQEGEG